MAVGAGSAPARCVDVSGAPRGAGRRPAGIAGIATPAVWKRRDRDARRLDSVTGSRQYVLMTEEIKRAPGATWAWWIGLAGHILLLPWYAASGLVAPAWAVVMLLAIWVVLLGVGLALRRRAPIWMLAIPVLDAAIWAGVISAGAALFQWTA
jgi:hypothetical protein